MFNYYFDEDRDTHADTVKLFQEIQSGKYEAYWSKLKERLNEEGAFQLLTNCQQLKLKAVDGKRYNTDAANAEQLLRIIQSVPSPKA